MAKKILIIAGSDSSGGAGIQADIKTACAFETYAMTAITALTAQNTETVEDILDVPEEFIEKQISCSSRDIAPDAIKTGMLNSSAVIKAIDRQLENMPTTPLILDPVMVAKGGAALLKPDAIKSLKELLIPKAFLVTPNIPEAEILSKISINNEDDMIKAGKIIIEMGANAVLIKGGHMQGNIITDILIEGEKIFNFVGKRIISTNTHGTGCTLATAIACGVANGEGLKEAVTAARKYVRNAITKAPNLGKGNGPLNHCVNR